MNLSPCKDNKKRELLFMNPWSASPPIIASASLEPVAKSLQRCQGCLNRIGAPPSLLAIRAYLWLAYSLFLVLCLMTDLFFLSLTTLYHATPSCTSPSIFSTLSFISILCFSRHTLWLTCPLVNTYSQRSRPLFADHIIIIHYWSVVNLSSSKKKPILVIQYAYLL